MLVRGLGIRTGPGRCREARARPVHPNRAWAMQEGSWEAWASENGLARSDWNLGAAWACMKARARHGHPNRAWAMQGGSAYASEQGLDDAERLVGSMGI